MDPSTKAIVTTRVWHSLFLLFYNGFFYFFILLATILASIDTMEEKWLGYIYIYKEIFLILSYNLAAGILGCCHFKTLLMDPLYCFIVSICIEKSQYYWQH